MKNLERARALRQAAVLKGEARAVRVATARRLAAEGLALRDIASRLSTHPNTLARWLAEAGVQPLRGGGLPHGLPWC